MKTFIEGLNSEITPPKLDKAPGRLTALSRNYALDPKALYFQSNKIADVKGKEILFTGSMSFHEDNLRNLLPNFNMRVKPAERKIDYENDDL